MVPERAATVSTAMSGPHSCTGSPGRASGRSVTSTISMSIDTRPASGATRPFTSTGVPFAALRG